VGKPGPKSVELKDLEIEANEWARVLFCLRDGRAGMVQRIAFRPWQSISSEKPGQKISDLIKGTGWEGARILKATGKHRVGTALVASIVPANLKTVSKVSDALNPDIFKSLKLNEGWDYTPPILPSEQIWGRLKKATSVKEMRSALRAAQRFLFHNWKQWHSGSIPCKLQRHATALLKAKQQFNYPKSRRNRSDDKRVAFFAKALAGLELDRSPLYTSKRLSHWRPARDLAINPHREFVSAVSLKGAQK
jgi:hypothetical protein